MIAGNFIPHADAYLFVTGYGCQSSVKWNHLGVSYYNGASANDRLSVDFAAAAWTDTPTPVYLVPGSSSSSDIRVSSTNDAPPISGAIGSTVYACSGAYFSGQTNITLYDSNMGGWNQDKITSTVAHEMGHALGLNHPPYPLTSRYSVRWSLMYQDSSFYDNYKIFVPVADDIKGLAQLYGWAPHTTFYSSLSRGDVRTGCVPIPCAPPLALRVFTPDSGSFTQPYNTTTLPNSNIAVMFAYVTPTTVYRFHMGWERASDPTSLQNRYATIELDNDGIKLVTSTGAGAMLNVFTFVSGSSVTANTSYFLELVVECCNVLKATAYAFQGSMATGNAGETFLGSLDTANGLIDGWGSAHIFDAAVWTDSPSNPASFYNLDHFWNYQGPALKLPGGGSVAAGTLITQADGSSLPVQNLKPGMRLLSYDTVTNRYTVSTITRMELVHTDNQLMIRTEDGLPLRTDNATRQMLFVRQANGIVGWLSVTRLRVGDYLFNALERRWVRVTAMEYVNAPFTMYDIYTTAPYNYIANNYLDPVKEGPSP